MSDYINREDAIKAFDPNQRRDWYTPWIVETLKDIPSADVAPVRHGRWISDDIGFKCTSCGSHDESTSIYCPNCGAKMDEEE